MVFPTDEHDLRDTNPKDGPRRELCKFAGAKFKFYKSRSKFTVKVTCLKSMAPVERSGYKEHIICPI